MAWPVVLDEIVVGDDPSAWEAAGFDIGDGGAFRVGAVTLRCAGSGGRRGILSWRFRGVPDPPDTIDGLPTTFLPHVDAPPEPGPTHPNGVVAVDHVVVLTPHSPRTTAAFEVIGLDVRRVRPTNLGGRPIVQTFYRAGEAVIEQVGPEGGDGTGPSSFYGIGFTVTGLDTTAARLGAALSEARAAVQPGREIATLRHRSLGVSVPVVFLSPRPPTATERFEAS